MVKAVISNLYRLCQNRGGAEKTGVGARMNKPRLWGLIGALVGAKLFFLLFGSIGVAVWGLSGAMVFGLVWWVVGGIVGGVGAYGLAQKQPGPPA